MERDNKTGNFSVPFGWFCAILVVGVLIIASNEAGTGFHRSDHPALTAPAPSAEPTNDLVSNRPAPLPTTITHRSTPSDHANLRERKRQELLADFERDYGDTYRLLRRQAKSIEDMGYNPHDPRRPGVLREPARCPNVLPASQGSGGEHGNTPRHHPPTQGRGHLPRSTLSPSAEAPQAHRASQTELANSATGN